MKVTQFYSRLERTKYEFDESDVKEALVRYSGLDKSKHKSTIKMDWWGDDHLVVELTAEYEQEEKAELK